MGPLCVGLRAMLFLRLCVLCYRGFACYVIFKALRAMFLFEADWRALLALANIKYGFQEAILKHYSFHRSENMFLFEADWQALLALYERCFALICKADRVFTGAGLP
jgi:hypothetical protein